MANITLPYPTFTYGTVIDQSQVNANNAAILAQVNGNIDNTNISATANIAVSKLNLSAGGAALNKSTTGVHTWGTGLTTDTQPQVTMVTDGGLQFGAGGASTVDVRLKRSAANTLQLGKQDGSTGATLDINSGSLAAIISISLKNTNTATITPAAFGADRAISFLDPGAAANLACLDTTVVNHDLCQFNGSRVTRLAPGTGGQMVVSNGTNFISSAPFQSTGQTITAAGALTLAHGLGYKPLHVWVALVNGTGEAGYTAGQTVYVSGSPGAANTGVSVIVDSTNLTVRYGSGANTFSIPHATTGVNTALTNADWTAVFFAV